MRNPIVPCIWLDDQAAAAFYTAIFPASRTTATSHYPEDADTDQPTHGVSLLSQRNQSFVSLDTRPAESADGHP